jgi:hypothetical protein
MMHAIKAKYNRKTGKYDVKLVLQADPLYAHEGYLVFDDPARVAQGIRDGSVMTHVAEPQRDALLAWLDLAHIA